jgi:hypothetical protein
MVKKKIIIAVCFILVVVLGLGIVIKATTNNVENKVVTQSTPDTIVQITVAPTTEEPTSIEPTTQEVTEQIVETEAVVQEETEYVDVEESYEDENEESYSDDYSNDYVNYSDYELDLLARTIYQEAGICGEYCQWLVGSTVLNLADERGGIENVVFDYDTFNVAYILYDCTPSNLSYSVASRLLSGDRDYSVKAFRTNYYHSFGTPYTNVDNVYFSTY